jgi:hypothetical protein
MLQLDLGMRNDQAGQYSSWRKLLLFPPPPYDCITLREKERVGSESLK